MHEKILGLDMGGTNLDAVILEDDDVKKTLKVPVQRDDLLGSVMQCLKEITKDQDPDSWTRIHLSTTLTTNRIAEDRLDPVTLVIQEGPGLVENYEGKGIDLYKLSGAIDHRGIVTGKVPNKELRALESQVDPEHYPNLAVVCKFGTRNPNVEQEIASHLESQFHSLTLGHRLSGTLNFPRRVRTAWLNAAVYEAFSTFAKAISDGLKNAGITAPIYILKADAGTLPLSSAEEQPVQSILSGPAASFLGLTALEPTNEDAILLDIGGTTTDIFYLVEGEPLFEAQGASLAGYKTLIRALFCDTIALGGDSLVHFVDGELKLGPRRSPTPPTLSDAFRLLGRLDDGQDTSVFEDLAREHDLKPKAFAQQCVELAAQMIHDQVTKRLEALSRYPLYTVREVLENRQLEPKLWQVIGGPAEALKPEIEELAGVPVHVPKSAEVANAIGAALARPTQVLTLHADTEAGMLRIPELGVQESISKRYDLPNAKQRMIQELRKIAQDLGLAEDEIEITEEQRFLMLDGYRQGLNIRLEGQIRPGLMTKKQ